MTEGYRMVLTYNLLLDPTATAPVADAAAAGALADRIRLYFETPKWSRLERIRSLHRRGDDPEPEPEPPNRFVHLLDHQYTERGLAWDRLKGDDAARVEVLRAAAELADCEMALALADVHETWSCEDDGFDPYDAWGRYGSRGYDEDEDFDDDGDLMDDGPPPDDPDGHTLTDLQDRSTTLLHWIPPGRKRAESIHTTVYEDEVIGIAPSSGFEPYASEHEGYMGNYGNTVDRWYRRAAVVLWPRDRAFAVRAEISPAWAVKELRRRIRAGSLDVARERAESLFPIWKSKAPHQKGSRFLTDVLTVAEGLDARNSRHGSSLRSGWRSSPPARLRHSPRRPTGTAPPGPGLSWPPGPPPNTTGGANLTATTDTNGRLRCRRSATRWTPSHRWTTRHEFPSRGSCWRTRVAG